MKKLLLLISILFCFQFQTKASHVLGGEIRWECLSNGRYVFFAKLFRDCTGADVQFNDSYGTLTIVGNPLPRSSNNGNIGSIVMKPDSNTWQNNRNGDTSPTCAPGGTAITCPGRDLGAVQQFFWQSDPIVLRGTPPANGWKFYMTPPCCRPNVTNLQGGSNMVLRAIMYPDRNGTPVDNCIDSSPEFLALPNSSACRGYEFTYTHTAIDKDLDSLVYAWDRTLDGPPTAPQPVPYANGYNFNNPTPDKTFNNLNTPATLDPITGQIKVGVYSGAGSLDYLTVVRVDAWREGRVIASVFREIPFVFFDCPRLANGRRNNKTDVIIANDTAEAKTIEVIAGSTVRVPLQFLDTDTSFTNFGQQKITVEPLGFMFSRDLQDSRFCLYNKPFGTPGSEPMSCAYFQNQDAVFNGTAEPPRYELSGFLGIATEFVWETKCHHAPAVQGRVLSESESIYNFVFKAYDDHCPIPGITYPTITIKVRNPILDEPIMKGVSVGLDGRLTYSWVPPIDSLNYFFEYDVEVSPVANGQAPTVYQQLGNSPIKKYRKEERNTSYRIFNRVFGTVDKWDILSLIDQDYYIRMTTISGCRGDAPSLPSEPARVMELNASPTDSLSNSNPRSRITLNWNASKAANANSYPYFVYESPTTYYIHTNEAIDDRATGIEVDSLWVERLSTQDTSIEISSSKCNGYVGYRIEARDTVITYKQGQGGVFPNDTLDTLVYSTFSTVDTLFTVFENARAFQENFDFIYVDPVYEQIQWIDCDSNTIITNSRSNRFFPSQPGNYAAEVEIDSCNDTTNCIEVKALDNSVFILSFLELRSNEANANYQWIDCRADTIIPGANARNFLPLDTGFYAVVLSKFGMKDTSSCFAMLFTALNEKAWSSQISIFPNPSTGMLSIQSDLNENLILKLFNIQGQLVQEEILVNPNNQIELLGEKGLYFISITNQKGEQANFKVVKQ